MAQPTKLLLESRLELSKAMEAEYVGDFERAVDHYKTYQVIRGTQRARSGDRRLCRVAPESSR